MPLVVKLSMIVVLTVNTRRQRDGKRTMRAHRMRREPTGRRGFERFTISSNRSQQRAAQRASSSDTTARQKVRPAPRHGPTSILADRASVDVSQARIRAAPSPVSARASCCCFISFPHAPARHARTNWRFSPIPHKSSTVTIPALFLAGTAQKYMYFAASQSRAESGVRQGFVMLLHFLSTRARTTRQRESRTTKAKIPTAESPDGMTARSASEKRTIYIYHCAACKRRALSYDVYDV